MPLPTSRAELRDKLRTAHTKLDAELEALEGRAETKTARALVAYQIGWGKLLLGWEAAERTGKVPAMPAKGFKWNQLGALAESFHRAYADRTLEQLRKELARTVKKIDAWIGALDEAELFEFEQRRWAGVKWPLVKWIQVNTIAPYTSATAKLRKLEKARGR